MVANSCRTDCNCSCSVSKSWQLATAVQLWSVVVQSSCQSFDWSWAGTLKHYQRCLISPWTLSPRWFWHFIMDLPPPDLKHFVPRSVWTFTMLFQAWSHQIYWRYGHIQCSVSLDDLGLDSNVLKLIILPFCWLRSNSSKTTWDLYLLVECTPSMTQTYSYHSNQLSITSTDSLLSTIITPLWMSYLQTCAHYQCTPSPDLQVWPSYSTLLIWGWP